VRAAQIELTGALTVMAPTDDLGQFTLASETETTLEFVPRKTGDGGEAVSALDAVHVLQSIVGQRGFGANQTRACDVSGNGRLTSLDAALILQRTVGAITRFPVAERCGSEWCFVPEPAVVPNQVVTLPDATQCRPGTIRIDPLVDEAAAQNFSAILFGDCSGNWQPSADTTTAALSADAAPLVRIGAARKTRSGRWRVPISVEGGAFHALDLDLRYDARTAAAPRVLALGAVRQAMLQWHTPVPGRLRVALASVTPVQPDGQVTVVVELSGAGGRPPVRARAVIDDRPAVVVQVTGASAQTR